MERKKDKSDTKSSMSTGETSSICSNAKSMKEKLILKANELAEKKKREREAHPERLLYFKPKFYEFWRDNEIDDEITEQEKLMKEIVEKEAEINRKKASGEFDSQDEQEEEDLNQQKAVLQRLKSRKLREATYLVQLEEEMEREAQEKSLQEAERLISELQNPSLYGFFYTDGYYEVDDLFGLSDEILEKMTEEQELWKEQWGEKHTESFTEKFKRHFWPPKLILKDKMFRTRGTYMDFPEVIADWPKAIDVNFEKEEHNLLSNAIFVQDEIDPDALKEEAEHLKDDDHHHGADGEDMWGEINGMGNGVGERGLGAGGIQSIFDDPNKVQLKIGQTTNHGWDQWYYDDALGEFLPKKEGFSIEYYMDSLNQCWRHKRPLRYPVGRQPTPYDWYFDFESGTFVAREDYLGFDELVYDKTYAVFKVQPVVHSKSKTKSIKDINKRTMSTTNTSQSIETNKKEKKYKVNDYYFDEEKGKWLLMVTDSEDSEEKVKDIEWDENGFRFTKKFEGDWRGLTGLCPDDYYFDDKRGKFYSKPPRTGKDFTYYQKDGVWRKSNATVPNKLIPTTEKTPNDYYFDPLEGQFKIRDRVPNKYWLQKHARIWRKQPEPESQMFPEDFYWDQNKKLWIPRSIRMEMLRNAKTTNSQWNSEKGPSNAKPSFYFWDTEEGRFLLKVKNDKYYMDRDGFWKSEMLKNKRKERTFPHDFFYDSKDNKFYRKKKDNPYFFNTRVNVWTNSNTQEEFEFKFFYDVEQEKWIAGEIGDADNPESETTNLGIPTNLGFPIKSHTNGNIKIPDDFWFDEKEGRFYPKKIEENENTEASQSQYVYNSTEGVWKKKGNTTPNPNGLHPRNFYFDDHDSKFKLKIDGQNKDYWYDASNKIFRHVVSIGQTRSGLQPKDFYWNSELKTFVLEKIKDKSRGKTINDLPKWDPMRRYDKGWLPPSARSSVTSTTAASSATGYSSKASSYNGSASTAKTASTVKIAESTVSTVVSTEDSRADPTSGKESDDKKPFNDPEELSDFKI